MYLIVLITYDQTKITSERGVVTSHTGNETKGCVDW
jgi:hypothetical protein